VTYQVKKGWLRVYSVATGRLLRAWVASHSLMASRLTWIHGDSGIGLMEFTDLENMSRDPLAEDVRVMDMATGDAGAGQGLAAAAAAGQSYPGAADLFTSSQVVWSLRVPAPSAPSDPSLCQDAMLTADASTVVCANSQESPSPGRKVTLTWLAYPVSVPGTVRVVGSLPVGHAVDAPVTGGFTPGGGRPPALGDHVVRSVVAVTWASADGRTVLGSWETWVEGKQDNHGMYALIDTHAIGVASGGRLTPLPFNPAAGAGLTAA
jgi:hypothetical protein